MGETAVKASRAGRDCRLAALERRLGPYRPAPPDRAVAARAPEPDRADAPRWAAYRAARGEYQAGRRAETMARRDALRAAREALAAAHRRERAALAASFPEGGRTGLVARRRVLALDMRNHGDSFWHESHSYPDLADDLARVIEAEGIAARLLRCFEELRP